MAEVTQPEAQAACPSCGALSELQEIGTASGRGHYSCPTCGPWRAKNAAASAFGSLGGQARASALSPEARSRIASEAATKRWQDEKLKKNLKPDKA